MAYVFGMDVPVFEIQFVLMILMMAGMGFILYEIQRLVKLISQEKTAIKRFEDDLSQFEGGKKPSADVINFVNDAKNRGLSNFQIQQSLMASGWKMSDIEKVLR